MFEPLVQAELDRYLSTLNQELRAQGLSIDAAKFVVQEAQAHLEEAMECADAKTVVDAQTVLTEFGSAKRFAAKHAEALRRPSRTAILWPCLVLLVLLSLHNAPFANHLWHYATVSLVGGNALILCLAFRARKPVFTGLIASACAFLVLHTAWNTAFTVPDQFVWGWSTTIPVGGIKDQETSLNKAMVNLGAGIDQIHRGTQIFTEANRGKPVPPAFMYQGCYWVPEGIRELHLGLPTAELSPLLRVKTWDQAVNEWSTNGTIGGSSNAVRALISDQDTIGSGLASLAWVQKQSILVRCAVTFINSLHIVAPYLLLAMLAAASGWFSWLFSNWVGVERRRRAVGGETVKAAS